MNCTNDIKHWTIYDAKIKQFHHLTHEEFKSFLLDYSVTLEGKFISVNSMEKVWIDGMINTEWFT